MPKLNSRFSLPGEKWQPKTTLARNTYNPDIMNVYRAVNKNEKKQQWVYGKMEDVTSSK